MKQIWIVDDTIEMADAVGKMLQLLDCATRHFSSARAAAKELLDGKRPDLILLDISMPEVDGIMMLEFIRRRSEWKDLPVVMLSSETSEVQVEHTFRLGADGYIHKPVLLEELENALIKAWKKHGKM